MEAAISAALAGRLRPVAMAAHAKKRRSLIIYAGICAVYQIVAGLNRIAVDAFNSGG
jgi:hypothetical protein